MATLDDYLKNLTPPQRAEYQRLDKIIKSLAPDVKETMSYGIPTFKYKGKNLIHFGAFPNHMSIFPGSGPIAALKEKLAGYKTAKGTIQFTEDKPLPDELLKEIVTLAKEAIDQR